MYCLQRFFQCGLGYGQAGHHWGYNETTEKMFKLGKCMQGNMQTNRSLFEDCGDFQVWTDIGYLEDRTKANRGKKLDCFFPTMHGGLEAFYQSHPTGTILNVVRDPDQWYESAIGWRKLPERMSKSCAGFPPPRSEAPVWREFYLWHTQHVRDFAAEHPSLTYLEVSLEADDTGKILAQHTGIPQVCWGDCNPDRNKEQCHVFQKKRDYELEQQEKREYELEQQKKKNRPGVLAPKDKRPRTTKKQGELKGDLQWADVQKRFSHYQDQPVQLVDGKIASLNR